MQMAAADPADSAAFTDPGYLDSATPATMPYTPLLGAMDFAAVSPAQMLGTAMVGQIFRDSSPAWTASTHDSPTLAHPSPAQQQALAAEAEQLEQQAAFHQQASPGQDVSALYQAADMPDLSPQQAAQEMQPSEAHGPDRTPTLPAYDSPASFTPAPSGSSAGMPAAADATAPFAGLAVPPVFSHMADATPPPLSQPGRYIPTPYPFAGVPAVRYQLPTPGPASQASAKQAAPSPQPSAAPGLGSTTATFGDSFALLPGQSLPSTPKVAADTAPPAAALAAATPAAVTSPSPEAAKPASSTLSPGPPAAAAPPNPTQPPSAALGSPVAGWAAQHALGLTHSTQPDAEITVEPTEAKLAPAQVPTGASSPTGSMFSTQAVMDGPSPAPASILSLAPSPDIQHADLEAEELAGPEPQPAEQQPSPGLDPAMLASPARAQRRSLESMPSPGAISIPSSPVTTACQTALHPGC